MNQEVTILAFLFAALFIGVLATVGIPLWAKRLDPSHPEDREMRWLDYHRKYVSSVDPIPMRASNHPSGLLGGLPLGSSCYLSGRACLAIERGELELFLIRLNIPLHEASENLRSGDLGIAFRIRGQHRTQHPKRSDRWMEDKWTHSVFGCRTDSPAHVQWTESVARVYQVYPGLRRISTFGDKVLLIAEPYFNTHDVQKLLDALQLIVVQSWAIDLPKLIPTTD